MATLSTAAAAAAAAAAVAAKARGSDASPRSRSPSKSPRGAKSEGPTASHTATRSVHKKFTRSSLTRGGTAWAQDREADHDFLQGLHRTISARIRKGAPPAGTGETGSGSDYTGDDLPANNSDSDSEGSLQDNVRSQRSAVPLRNPVYLRNQPRDDDTPPRFSRFVVSPRSNAKIRWDLFVGGLIMYTVLVQPWRIGFEQDATGPAVVLDYCIDTCFFVDMILCFVTGYHTEQDTYVADPAKIAKRYLTSFFLPDFLSFAPIDVIVEAATSGGAGLELRSIKLMKFVRLIRLMKLIRVLKLQRFMTAIEERLNLNPSAIRLVKLLVTIIFIAHLLSCCWHYISMPVCGEDEEDGFPAIGPCPLLSPGESPTMPNWVRVSGVDRFDLVSRYLASFHFVTATMMAVGYGDIHATDTPERIVAILMQLTGATAFGFILSAVTTLLDSANLRDTEYRRRMLEVKEWMQGRQIPTALKKAVREHFVYALSKKSIFNELEVLSNLPTYLRSQIIQHSYSRWLHKLECCFSDEDLSLRVDLVLHLKPQQASKGDIVIEPGEISPEVYVVLNGRLEVILDGNDRAPQPITEWPRQCLQKVIGGTRDVLSGFLQNGDLFGQFPACPMMVRCTHNHCELLSLRKDMLFYVLSRFPGALTRYNDNEEKQYKEIIKVLESREIPVGDPQIICKANVLLQGKARPARDLSLEHLTLTTASAWDGDEDAVEQGGEVEGVDSSQDRPVFAVKTKQSLRSMTMLDLSARTTQLNRMPGHHKLLRTLRPVADGSGDTEEVDETEADILRRFVVPPFYKYKFRFDVLIGFLIGYSILMIPFRLGFGVENTDAGIAFDLVVDSLFCLDLLLNFRVAFVDADGLTNTVPSEIRKRYLQSWFIMDLVSSVPFDQMMEASMGHGAGALKLVRTVRLARLLKLARLLRMGRLMRTLEEVADLSPIMVKVLSLGFRLAVLAHLLGCFFFYMSLQEDLDQGSCESAKLNCRPNEGATMWWRSIRIPKDDLGSQYVAAIYWAFTTMTTVGYGDIVPVNNYERVYTIATMVCGGTIFGYIIGSIAALAGQDHGSEALTKKRISLIRDYCTEQNIPKNKQDMLRLHYHFFYQERSPFNEIGILSELPATLRKQVILHIHREALSRLGLFVGASLQGLPSGPLPRWFVTWTMRLLEPQVVVAGEDVLCADAEAVMHEMFFVHDGECEAYVRRLELHRMGAQNTPDTGGSCDESQAIDSPAGGSTANSFRSGRCRRTRTLMVFSPGCMFGLEHLLGGRCKYSVRCSRSGPCFLYVLRQAVIAEVSQSLPEMSIAIRTAISNALIHQMKMRVPQWNLEQRIRAPNVERRWSVHQPS